MERQVGRVLVETLAFLGDTNELIFQCLRLHLDCFVVFAHFGDLIVVGFEPRRHDVHVGFDASQIVLKGALVNVKVGPELFEGLTLVLHLLHYVFVLLHLAFNHFKFRRLLFETADDIVDTTLSHVQQILHNLPHTLLKYEPGDFAGAIILEHLEHIVCKVNLSLVVCYFAARYLFVQLCVPLLLGLFGRRGVHHCTIQLSPILTLVILQHLVEGHFGVRSADHYTVIFKGLLVVLSVHLTLDG